MEKMNVRKFDKKKKQTDEKKMKHLPVKTRKNRGPKKKKKMNVTNSDKKKRWKNETPTREDPQESRI